MQLHHSKRPEFHTQKKYCVTSVNKTNILVKSDFIDKADGKKKGNMTQHTGRNFKQACGSFKLYNVLFT